MTKKYFTVEQATNMIPMLEERMYRLKQINWQVRLLYSDLKERGYAPKGDDFDFWPSGADADTIDELSTLKLLVKAMKREYATLVSAGCVVKQIDRGVVDWYAKIDGREVFLSWRLGEKCVSHWHELETGYKDRRSIAELVSSESE
ncbi:MAG: DUF2203 domain-containing protein [Pseudomonadota bacterium]